MAGIRVTITAGRRTHASSRLMLGGLVALLTALFGAALLRTSVAYFSGPLPVVPLGVEDASGDVGIDPSLVCAADVPTCEDVLSYDLESGACVTNLGRACVEAREPDHHTGSPLASAAGPIQLRTADA